MGLSPEDILDDHTPAVIELVQQLRDLVRSSMPDATERIYPGRAGIGFHHPTAGYVCALFPGADNVRVGFEHGTCYHIRTACSIPAGAGSAMSPLSD